MMKYVYKNEKGLVVLNEKVAILDLASIDDLRNVVKVINENIKKHELNVRAFDPEYTTPRTFFDELNINPNDKLTLKEDVFYWDKDVNEFLSYESVQSFDNPYSWTDEEKVEFMNIIQLWIASNDHTYDLYEFLRDMREGRNYLPEANECVLKFERLFHNDIKSMDNGTLENFDKHYKQQKEEYEQYKLSEMPETVIQ
ncbi:hypothetical protein [Schinkia azotoformans]|uniref:hypothetical protein n=1 Tax=Schinkia azotoformans TaxID=1454 RepID=UPI002DB71DC5|nr:hypothetical protein [Schinkia azotoformans]MEC1697735.1 hypothetical protein [Schinkia azotoformans]